jgi:Tfp pilus assembly protein PilV
MGTPPVQGAPRNLSSEAGVTLIETLISAVILVIIVGAVMTTIDASGRTTAVNKNRSVAATLAEQDQERLRAMSPTLLATYSAAPQTVMVGDAGHQVPYTVDSDVEWVFDATGATQSCENSGSQANYLRISSTVTSSVVGTRVRPVTMRSIVAPRVESFPENTGTLTVKVADQLGGPVANMPVTISPAASIPRNTNEFGCAVFSHIPVGAYTATLDSLGYVNEQRQQTYSSSSNVNLSQTTNLGMTYALATSIAVRVKTDIGGGPIDSFAHAVTVANAKSGDVVAISPAGALTNTITVPSLFPYPDGYTAFTGRCGLNDPADPSYQPANAAYVATAPGFTNVTPGVPASVTTHQPSVNLKVVGSGSTPLSGANMVFTPVPASCGSVSNTTKFARTSGADGFATERGLPFGKYTVCVDKVISGTTRRETMASTIDNTSPAGVTPTQMTLTTADTAGGCP